MKEIDYSFMEDVASRCGKPLHDVQREQANEIKRLNRENRMYMAVAVLCLVVTFVTLVYAN
jgi:ribosomal protein L34E